MTADIDIEELRRLVAERCMPANTPDSLFGRKLFPIERETFLDLLDAIAAKDAEIERLRGLLTWFLVPSLEEGEHEATTTGTLCWICDQPWPCPTERASAALNPEEPTNDR